MTYNSTIQPKLKPCVQCGDPSFIFSLGKCKRCAQWSKIKSTGRSHIGLKQTTDGLEARPFKVGKPIKKVSDKELVRLAKYRKARKEYLKEKTVCEYPGCEVAGNLDLHHVAGRIGELLYDKTNFKALCRYHHSLIENNPLHAKELKLSSDRLSVIQPDLI